MTTDSKMLNTNYNLSLNEITEFQTNGHILLKDIVDQNEMVHFRPIINDAAHKYNTEKRKMEERDTYGKAFLQIMNLWEVDEPVRNFVLAKRFAKIASQLLGVDNVRIYHDQALYKEPGGGHTPWHQDQYYWPLDTSKTITMWMPLVNITKEMGMLTFASGSHNNGSVKSVEISDESESILNDYISQKKFPIIRPDFMNAGDATWHSGWTLHAAPGNTSNIMREVMTIIYFADGAKVIEPQNKNQEDDRLRWLNGIEPGKLADSPLNPIV